MLETRLTHAHPLPARNNTETGNRTKSTACIRTGKCSQPTGYSHCQRTAKVCLMEPMEFDRRWCRAGFQKFVRELQKPERQGASRR